MDSVTDENVRDFQGHHIKSISSISCMKNESNDQGIKAEIEWTCDNELQYMNNRPITSSSGNLDTSSVGISVKEAIDLPIMDETVHDENETPHMIVKTESMRNTCDLQQDVHYFSDDVDTNPDNQEVRRESSADEGEPKKKAPRIDKTSPEKAIKGKRQKVISPEPAPRQRVISPEPTLKKGRVKKKVDSYLFSESQEDELVDWYEAHPVFYMKGLKNFKNTRLKDKLMEEFGATLDPPASGPQIDKWLRNMRTNYARLTHPASKPSGGPGGEWSDRAKWVLRRFNFLAKHICRHRVKGNDRLLVNMFPLGDDDNASSSYSSSSGSTNESSDLDEAPANQPSTSHQSTSFQSASENRVKGKRKKKSKKDEAESVAIKDLVSLIKETVRGQPERPDPELAGFMADMTHLMRLVPEDKRIEARMKLLGVLDSYINSPAEPLRVPGGVFPPQPNSQAGYIVFQQQNQQVQQAQQALIQSSRSQHGHNNKKILSKK